MKKKLKVLMLTTSFPRFRGDGAGVFVYHLCRGLDKAGVSVDILAPHAPGCNRDEVWEGLRIFRFPYFLPFHYQRLCYGSGVLKNMKGSLLAAFQVPSLILAEILSAFSKTIARNYDLVHAHWVFPQGFIALLLKAVQGIPMVATIHGSDVYGLKAPLLKAVNASVIHRANRCTVNSKSTAIMARSISGREDIDLIPMGVDTELFRAVEGNGVKESDRADKKTILFVGRLIEFKGVEYLLRSLPEVLKHYPRLRALIVGSGPQEGSLMDLTRRLGLERHVEFRGSVPQAELPRLYSAADVFVLPSIISRTGETEGLGVVLLEAMACGTPAIGTDIGGIPDIIKDGETGFLVRQKDPDDLASKVIEIFDNEKLRREMRQNALDHVRKRFSWPTIAVQFKRVYEETVEKDERHRENRQCL
jgi:glycosyltransferase involved in cell wall biosynthesis